MVCGKGGGRGLYLCCASRLRGVRGRAIVCELLLFQSLHARVLCLKLTRYVFTVQSVHSVFRGFLNRTSMIATGRRLIGMLWLASIRGKLDLERQEGGGGASTYPITLVDGNGEGVGVCVCKRVLDTIVELWGGGGGVDTVVGGGVGGYACTYPLPL